ncbi:PREDICTED: mitogen-activated protein kinase kinase kinase YODA-like isoform X2 [Nelumbo nucifera]|uniref:mitogen-activated protein kinase kinase kinase n=1 Tax=Nelumbo nucifera TaxID=4432 RepID=A0A1U7ZAS8_NELNU|nr:PREDICTED: mitogen-activated protein kinase kinase kinase YODA-like isoform X2 [Nelumbo nucifera]
MHWWQITFSSSSSSSPKSSSIGSRMRRNVRDLNFFRNHRASRSQPRLTRQRKLRHLSDVDISRLSLNTSPSDIPKSVPVSRSPSNLDHFSGVPQPLPRPDVSALSRRESGFSSPNHVDLPLPSPKETPSRGEGENGDRKDCLIGDVKREGIPASSTIGRSSYQAVHKSPEHVNTPSARFPKDCMREVLHEQITVDNVQFKSMLNLYPKSAPTSGFSSPTLSPRRFSNCDAFPYSSIQSQGFQTWSAPEFPNFDMLVGLSPRASPDKILSSPDHSPIQSPTVNSPGLKIKSPRVSCSSQSRRSFSGAVSTLHPAAWHDNNGHSNVHPLPLPPGAILPPLSTSFHQTTAKPEVSSKAGQWQKGKLIGSGTFGSVYVATNRETGASCAMKEVNLIPDDPKSAECIKQLEQEIKVLSQLKHPNIVQFYGSEIIEERFYIYLEYVFPGSINKFIREHCGAITESVVRNFTRHILSGLAYLHSKKTIHRDIKGANLLVDASGVVKLADFGMAKHLDGHAAQLSLKGSPYWMAPEVIHSMMKKDTNSDLAYAVDIWSLGCTVIEMLNGKPPWSELEGAGAMFKVLRESPPIPETLSAEGKDFLRRCFQRNPADRPSASKLLEHPFLRNSTHLECPACLQAFSTTKLVDKAHSPRELNKYKSDPVPTSPGTQSTIGKGPSNGSFSAFSSVHPGVYS